MYQIKYQKIIATVLTVVAGSIFPLVVLFLTFRSLKVFNLANIIAVQMNYSNLENVVNSVPRNYFLNKHYKACYQVYLLGGFLLREL